MSAAPAWTSQTSADLLLSLRVPVGWELEVIDEFRLRVHAEHRDEHGYRANLGVARGKPDGAGPEWFAEFCAAVPGQLTATIEGYELVRADKFTLSSGAVGFAAWTRQHASGAPATSQLISYLWAGSQRMYVVDAATLRGHESRDFAVFESILHSIRVFAPRP